MLYCVIVVFLVKAQEECVVEEQLDQVAAVVEGQVEGRPRCVQRQ
jgi:hypothetical protein